MSLATRFSTAVTGGEATQILSGSRLRSVLGVFISLLLIALSVTTLGLVQHIFAEVTPAVRADLTWKARRGASELAQKIELEVVLRDPDMILQALGGYRINTDVLAILVEDAAGLALATHGAVPAAAHPFAQPAGIVTESDGWLISWSAVTIDGGTVGRVAVIISAARLQDGERTRRIMFGVIVLACLLALFVSRFFVTRYLGPVIQLTERTMSDLQELNLSLDARVRERTDLLSQANGRLEESLTQLHSTQRQLLEASRKTGMADVATAVLHNVGNVLNSVNVSAGVVMESVRLSKFSGFVKAVELMRANKADLGKFFAEDPRGLKLPAYLERLAEIVTAEQGAVVEELASLQKNIDHIKRVVATQQSHARSGGLVEDLKLEELVEDNIRLSLLQHDRHGVEVIRDFCVDVPLSTDRHKVSQILLNLLSNARHAVLDWGGEKKRIVVRTRVEGGQFAVAIEDTGCGIPPENLTRIFNHGFTTKKDGHGFGLHSSACAAIELGGSLLVQSPGPGAGATFTLTLPVRAEAR